MLLISTPGNALFVLSARNYVNFYIELIFSIIQKYFYKPAGRETVDNKSLRGVGFKKPQAINAATRTYNPPSCLISSPPLHNIHKLENKIENYWSGGGPRKYRLLLHLLPEL